MRLPDSVTGSFLVVLGTAAAYGGWLLPPALLLFYVAAADRLGFIITAALMVYATSTALGAKWKLALPLAALAPFGIHLIFAKLLRVPLPAGLLPTPW